MGILIDPGSLAGTLDAINQAFFYGQALTQSERKRAAKWIAAMQGKPGSYAGMFAPTRSDLTNGIKVFTGETVRSNAAVGHILGEESCRALILLDVADGAVKDALDRATLGMLRRLRQTETPSKVHGLYCCGICSPAYWRHVAVGGLDRNEERLAAGMKALKSHRIGNGRWRRFQFFYTLLALSELDLKSAVEEMRYAAPAVELYLKRTIGKSRLSERRQVICRRILAKC